MRQTKKHLEIQTANGIVRCSVEGYSAPLISASPDFVVAPHFAIPGCRAPAFLKTAATSTPVHVLWPKKAPLCETRLFLVSMLDDSRRPSFSSRLCICCSNGFAGRAAVSGPRRGAGRNLRRPRFASRHYDCCDAGIGCALCSGTRRPSSTRGHCNIQFCRGTLLFEFQEAARPDSVSSRS